MEQLKLVDEGQHLVDKRKRGEQESQRLNEISERSPRSPAFSDLHTVRNFVLPYYGLFATILLVLLLFPASPGRHCSNASPRVAADTIERMVDERLDKLEGEP